MQQCNSLHIICYPQSTVHRTDRGRLISKLIVAQSWYCKLDRYETLTAPRSVSCTSISWYLEFCVIGADLTIWDFQLKTKVRLKIKTILSPFSLCQHPNMIQTLKETALTRWDWKRKLNFLLWQSGTTSQVLLDICLGEGFRRKKRKNCRLLPNPPRTPPRLGLFSKEKKITHYFLKMNKWCVKQILHLVPSKNLYICFCYIYQFHLPKIGQNLISASAMALADRTKCKTWFGGPRMILYMLPEKILFQNRGLTFYYPPWPPSPVWQKTRLFSVQ